MLAVRVVVVLISLAGAHAQELLKAINDNNMAMVNIALKSGVKGGINAVMDDGDTALLLAIRRGKHKAVRAVKALHITRLPKLSVYTFCFGGASHHASPIIVSLRLLLCCAAQGAVEKHQNRPRCG